MSVTSVNRTTAVPAVAVNACLDRLTESICVKLMKILSDAAHSTPIRFVSSDLASSDLIFIDHLIDQNAIQRVKYAAPSSAQIVLIGTHNDALRVQESTLARVELDWTSEKVRCVTDSLLLPAAWSGRSKHWLSKRGFQFRLARWVEPPGALDTARSAAAMAAMANGPVPFEVLVKKYRFSEWAATQLLAYLLERGALIEECVSFESGNYWVSSPKSIDSLTTAINSDICRLGITGPSTPSTSDMRK